MHKFNVSNDIIPIGEFKSSISKWLTSVRSTGHPLVITQNGRPAGVLLSPAEYDELIYKKMFIESVNKGLADVESGDIYSTEELRQELHKRRLQRNSK